MERIRKYAETTQVGYGVFRDNVLEILDEELKANLADMIPRESVEISKQYRYCRCKELLFITQKYCPDCGAKIKRID